MGAVLLRHRRAPGAAVTAFAIGACLVWVAGTFAAHLASDFSQQLFAVNISYLGACATPVAILMFVSFYTQDHPLGWPAARRLLVIPTISALLVWTNPLHEFMWAHPPMESSGGFTIAADWGPWFLFVHLPYLWALVLFAEISLLRAALKGPTAVATGSHRVSRGQASTLFIGLTATFAVNVYTVLFGGSSAQASPTAVALALASVCFLWVFVQIEIVPFRYVAHRRVLHTMPDAMVVLDEQDRLLDLNPRAAELVTSGVGVGAPASEVFSDLPQILDVLELSGEVLAEVTLSSGTYYEIRVSHVQDAGGNRRGRTLLLRDITERHLSERRLRSIVDVSPNGIVRARACLDENGQIDDVECTFANAAAIQYLGVDPDIVPGASMLAEMPAVGPQLIGVFQRAFDEGEDQQVEVPVAGEGEDPLWYRLIVSPVDDELTITFMDVTEEKSHKEQMQKEAFLDPLTHALNRRGLDQAIVSTPDQARRGHGSHALLFLDLDRFKVVNDTYGHAAGDRLLKELVARLKSATRETDLVARVGGDEFVVLLLDSDVDTTAATVERLTQVTNAPYWLSGGAVTCSPSVGIAHAQDATGLAQALIEADRAMYLAKAAGGGVKTAAPHPRAQRPARAPTG